MVFLLFWMVVQDNSCPEVDDMIVLCDVGG